MVRTAQVVALGEYGMVSVKECLSGQVWHIAAALVASSLRGTLAVGDGVTIEYRVIGGRGWTSSGLWYITGVAG